MPFKVQNLFTATRDFSAQIGLAVAFTVAASFSFAQDAETDPLLVSSMIADDLYFDQDRQFYHATGNVQIFFNGLELRAPSVAYDVVSNRVIVDGPLMLIDEAGQQTLYGEFADMSADLRDGVITSARQLIDQNMQIASDQMVRRDGRYTELEYARASACEVCSENATPLWELRARRAVHDQEARTITYNDAQLRIAGYPVLYTPWLRTPDPTVQRANGLLPPTYSVNSRLGTRVGLPYFVMLGNSADVTVTPEFVIDRQDAGNRLLQTLRGRYRQAFSSGYLEMHGAVSKDDLTRDNFRSFLFSNGRFDLDNGFNVMFQTQSSSDRAYIGTYDFFADRITTFGNDDVVFNENRLNNFFRFSRRESDELIAFDYTGFSALRDPNYTYGTPNRVLNSQWTLFDSFNAVPGNFTVNFGAQASYNEFGASNSRQRDINRLTTNVRWNDAWQAGNVLRVDSDASLFFDYYGIHDDAINPDSQSSSSGVVSTRLSWPFQLDTNSGSRHSITPSIGFVSFAAGDVTMPSVDGSIDEVDPFNYSSLRRFRRVNRNQNTQYDVTASDVDLTYRFETTSGYYIGGSAERDFILSTDNARLREGELFTTRFGKNGGDFRFSVISQFNPEFERISDRVTVSQNFDSLTLNGNYRRVDSDEAIGSPEEARRWGLGLTAQITQQIDARLGLTSDRYESEQSYTTGSLRFDDGVAWNSSVRWVYDRDSETYDNLRFTLGRSFDWGGNVSLLYEREDDTVRRRGVHFDFDNECVLLRAHIVRTDNILTNLDPVTEFSLNFELGAFGRGSETQIRRCN